MISTPSIPDIFRELVAEVATNLDIAIKFKHGTWVVIQDELIADSQSADNDVKNWANCIALIHDTDEKPQGFNAETFTPRIVIVCKSEKTWKSQKRTDESYIPTLYPMYRELGQVISDSGYFLGYNTAVLPKRDLYHIGSETSEGKDGYKLPKVLDGLIIEGLTLTLNLQTCNSYQEPNLCVLTPCPYGLETFFRTIFKSVSFTGLGTAILGATVNDYDFFDASGGLPPLFTPEIDWLNSGFGPYTEMAKVGDIFTASFNTALGFGDGFYIGQIRYGQAYVQFYYKVLGGVVVKMVTEIEQDFEYGVLCSSFPDYPAIMRSVLTWDKTTTEPYTMTGYELKVFGVSKYTETFPATSTYSKRTETTLAHMGVNETVQNIYSFGSQSPLTMTSIYKTRCKTQF